MKDFDIVKYLRENHLGSHAILGNYVDLHALKEEVDMPVTIELDMQWEPDEYAEVQKIFRDHNIKVSGGTGRPGTYQVTGKKEDILAYLKSEFYGMDEDSINYYYPELIGGMNEEAEDLNGIETSDLKKGDTVEYEGNEYIIGDFDTAGGANLVYLNKINGKPAEDSKDRYKKVHKSRVKKLNKEADYGNNQPVDEVPYVGTDDKLDGFGDEFEQDEPVSELEKPENIYADDEDSFEPSQDRMMDLGGEQIEQGIISLLDDGFEPEDVLDACKMFIDAHVNAAMQGKKF